MNSFPELHTSRLLLRRVTPSDAANVLQSYDKPEMNRYMSVQYHSAEEVQVQLDWYEEIFKNRDGIWWGICLKDTGEMIGNGGFHRWSREHRCIEIGYWILPQHQQQGYAAESVNAMCAYAFEEMNIHRIEAIVEGGNKASLKFLEKYGFSNEGCRKECEVKERQYIDLFMFALFNPAH
jgi:[ribosomal protein S5]-alanine N-acetyltransferase